MQYKKILARTLYVVVPFACIGIFMTVNGSVFPASEFFVKNTTAVATTTATTTRFNMDRVQLGNSGLTLSSPSAFSAVATNSSVKPVAKTTAADLLRTESFRYDNNGVIIDIDFLTYVEDAKVSLENIRQQYEKDLAELKQSQNVSYSVHPTERSGIAGIIVDAEYPVKHLQKIQRFEVLTFVLQNQVWRITAKYKDCDQKGQAMVQWMLESIQIAS